MNYVKGAVFLAFAGCVAGCEAGPDKSVDRGINAHPLSDMVAGIWIDPDGCDHWIIDDGVEGYLSERLAPDGRPVCSGVGEPTQVIGPFQDGSPFPDVI
ncbi:MAG: hypothetical protein P8N72_04740 [Flavimaricola sp.]|nr:hypothetical protein [Flavimaricola sp.]